MEWYNDSIACLDVAEHTLIEIEKKQREAIKDSSILPYLKVDIKNYLENCRSPLDYAANYIFDTYCKNKYTSHQLKNFNVYYPIRKSKSLFDICIRDKYRGLNNKSIIQIFESSQPFNVSWLDDLTKLINENKHRNLTLQNINNITKINHGSFGRVNFYGTTFSGNKNDLVVDGKMYSGFEMTAATRSINADFSREYIFADLNKIVTETLRPILIETKKVIVALHDIL